MRRYGSGQRRVSGWVLGGLMAAAAAVAQPQPEVPPGAPAGQGRQLTEQMLQRLIEVAERNGDKDLVARLKSMDPQVRQQAARDVFQKYRDQMGRGQRGALFGRVQGGPFGPLPAVAIAVTDKYVFVVRGDVLYQFDAETLKLINQATFGPPPAAAAPPPAAPQPPAEGGGK